MQFADYYAILGVDPSADGGAIKSAYRRLARRYHPDVAKGQRAVRRFLLVREAYEVLANAEKRCKYDTSISKPSLVSRPSDTQAARSRRRTVSSSESAIPRQVFQLIVSALDTFRLNLVIDIAQPRKMRPRMPVTYSGSVRVAGHSQQK